MKSRSIHSNVSLSEISAGAVEELFQRALAMVLANIDDPNTHDKAKRTITLKLEFKPKADRTATDIDIKVETKLAGAKPVETYMSIRKDGNEYLGFEPIQDEIPLGPSPN